MWWQTARSRMDLTRQGKIMGILNVTPDSFSDGGRHAGVEAALKHARTMIRDGAEIIDVGGESTRPGAPEVAIAEEIARTRPVIDALRAEWDGCISIDTSKAAVAEAALLAGADVVNDVSGLTADPEMVRVCAASGCGVVVMHMQGDPRTMQVAPHYEDVVAEVREFFEERLATLERGGIRREAICFDPGIGFGKTIRHNLKLLRDIGSLTVGGRPVLLGVSRKSFIGKALGSDDLADRAWPTVAITASTREAGVMIHRVHEVKPNHQALRMAEAILQGVNFPE
ncbi:dihydropteroate synthase [Luteolibacter sp. GHJ8]|uniref:Dihydropteroate synthase n=1 Tax=Luteolibacter rhizosphaerae TaxID=2989719 RepID=A0ABT3G3B9_9BACT|nr:dihydropteroate synthase [Luteolibacter rhizosphaerae]MCW1914347.1 dihydropteroate synthase [Luteolibacter rhizosphaerae]